jgi:hypothetical protein
LTAQQQRGHANVLLAVSENGFAAVVAPTTLADVLGDRPLVDPFPTLDPVSLAGVDEALGRALAHLVRLVRLEGIAGGEKGDVLAEEMPRKPPPQSHEACQFRLQAVPDNECIIADFEWRNAAELAAPQTNSADMTQVLIQHMRDQARPSAGRVETD